MGADGRNYIRRCANRAMNFKLIYNKNRDNFWGKSFLVWDCMSCIEVLVVD